MFSAFTVKVTSPEKVAAINFECAVKPSPRESFSASKTSSLLAALLDPGISEPPSSARIVRRKFRVGNRVLAYLQSHSVILATLCGLMSCRKSQHTPAGNSGQEKASECFTDYCHRTVKKNVKLNGCTFEVRELPFCSAGESEVGEAVAANVDENLRDYIFRKLKHHVPALKRFLIQFLSPLMPGADDPMADPFWLLCSRGIPDELCAVLPSLFASRYFTYYVYCHISQLLQIHSLQSAGLGKLSDQLNCRSIEDIFRLFEVIPSSVVENSVVWSALLDFVIISAVKGGSLSPVYTLRVCDAGTRCRLLMSTMSQVEPSERLLFVDMLKSCLTDIECPDLKQVVKKCIIAEKLHSEVIILQLWPLTVKHRRSHFVA